jgi:hypothetical protein
MSGIGYQGFFLSCRISEIKEEKRVIADDSQESCVQNMHIAFKFTRDIDRHQH